MFGKKFVGHLISRSAQSPEDRRNFLRSAGVAGLGVVGASAIGAVGGAMSASAATDQPADAATDLAVLNFALNLEYLEAEFYSFAAHGHGIAERFTHGKGTRGGVTGGHEVKFG